MPFDFRLPSDRYCLWWVSKAGCFPSHLWLQIQDSSSLLPPLALESACGQILQRGMALVLDLAVVQEAPKLAAGVTMIRDSDHLPPFQHRPDVCPIASTSSVVGTWSVAYAVVRPLKGLLTARVPGNGCGVGSS